MVCGIDSSPMTSFPVNVQTFLNQFSRILFNYPGISSSILHMREGERNREKEGEIGRKEEKERKKKEKKGGKREKKR